MNRSSNIIKRGFATESTSKKSGPFYTSPTFLGAATLIAVGSYIVFRKPSSIEMMKEKANQNVATLHKEAEKAKMKDSTEPSNL